jgi:dihydrofolate reductase
MSLDGYLAGPNGEADWILMDPDIDFSALMNAFDTVIMGRKTYEATKQMSGGAAMPGTQVYVISRTLKQEDCPDVTVSNNAAGTVATLKAATGKDIWLFGGGELFRSLLTLGLDDSVEVAERPRKAETRQAPRLPENRHDSAGIHARLILERGWTQGT